MVTESLFTSTFIEEIQKEQIVGISLVYFKKVVIFSTVILKVFHLMKHSIIEMDKPHISIAIKLKLIQFVIVNSQKRWCNLPIARNNQ